MATHTRTSKNQGAPPLSLSLCLPQQQQLFCVVVGEKKKKSIAAQSGVRRGDKICRWWWWSFFLCACARSRLVAYCIPCLSESFFVCFFSVLTVFFCCCSFLVFCAVWFARFLCGTVAKSFGPKPAHNTLLLLRFGSVCVLDANINNTAKQRRPRLFLAFHLSIRARQLNTFTNQQFLCPFFVSHLGCALHSIRLFGSIGSQKVFIYIIQVCVCEWKHFIVPNAMTSQR